MFHLPVRLKCEIAVEKQEWMWSIEQFVANMTVVVPFEVMACPFFVCCVQSEYHLD